MDFLSQLPLKATEEERKKWQEWRIRQLLADISDHDLFLQMLGFEESPAPVKPRREREV